MDYQTRQTHPHNLSYDESLLINTGHKKMSIAHHPLIQSLLERHSVTPDDQGCQQIIAEHLSPLGFTIEHLDSNNVSNLWCVHGHSSPTLVFAGHTDVVPSGPEIQWLFPPFTPTYHDGYLYARGSADMKVAIACMVLAAEQFINSQPHHAGSIGFLITSSEEITTEHGTQHVIDTLINQQHRHIDYCIVGEASSSHLLGDEIKIGRRGSLSGTLSILGKQGHIAYPQLAINPIHNALAALTEISQISWDQGNEHFAPTSWQISNIHAGTGANNVIPGELSILFNFRYSPLVTASELKSRLETVLQQHDINYKVAWNHSGKPFISQQGQLVNTTKTVIKEITGQNPKLSTSGGTSDARFIAPYQIETIELGFCNDSIHQINERVRIEDIPKLQQIYYNILQKILI